jgi:hypothetical protein
MQVDAPRIGGVRGEKLLARYSYVANWIADRIWPDLVFTGEAIYRTNGLLVFTRRKFEIS